MWYTISQRMGANLGTYKHPRDYRHPSIADLLMSHDDPATIAHAATQIGSPINARNSAYLHLGARYKQPVPFDRLPRS